MAIQRFKILFGKEFANAKPAWFVNGDEGKPERARCPHCKDAKAGKKCMGDLIQYGFEWDTHLTVFRCKCGKFFFAEYTIWNVGERGE